jgi:phage shock protein A
MPQVERRLREVSSRLRRAREELAVLDEQWSALEDSAEEARVRAMSRSRQALGAEIARLIAAQDDLLDRLVVDTPPIR